MSDCEIENETYDLAHCTLIQKLNATCSFIFVMSMSSLISYEIYNGANKWNKNEFLHKIPSKTVAGTCFVILSSVNIYRWHKHTTLKSKILIHKYNNHILKMKYTNKRIDYYAKESLLDYDNHKDLINKIKFSTNIQDIFDIALIGSVITLRVKNQILSPKSGVIGFIGCAIIGGYFAFCNNTLYNKELKKLNL
jgi:hypothetical protein